MSKALAIAPPMPVVGPGSALEFAGDVANHALFVADNAGALAVEHFSDEPTLYGELGVESLETEREAVRVLLELVKRAPLGPATRRGAREVAEASDQSEVLW